MILRDARAVVRDDNVPAAVSARVVPSLCRTAIEQAAIDATRRRRLHRGDAHDDVEQAIADADKTMRRLALGLVDDPDAAGQVYSLLDRRFGGWAADTVRAVQAGAHEGGAGLDMRGLLSDTGKLVDAIRTLP